MNPPKRAFRVARELSTAMEKTTERETARTPPSSPNATKALHLPSPSDAQQMTLCDPTVGCQPLKIPRSQSPLGRDPRPSNDGLTSRRLRQTVSPGHHRDRERHLRLLGRRRAALYNRPRGRGSPAAVRLPTLAKSTPPHERRRRLEAMQGAPRRYCVSSVRQARALRRGVNSSQVADPWIGPLTNLHPPNASGGNMYLQRSQRTSGVGAGL